MHTAWFQKHWNDDKAVLYEKEILEWSWSDLYTEGHNKLFESLRKVELVEAAYLRVCKCRNFG